jgi:hypothetical protein
LDEYNKLLAVVISAVFRMDLFLIRADCGMGWLEITGPDRITVLLLKQKFDKEGSMKIKAIL